jgi:hypothetical protein
VAIFRIVANLSISFNSLARVTIPLSHLICVTIPGLLICLSTVPIRSRRYWDYNVSRGVWRAPVPVSGRISTSINYQYSTHTLSLYPVYARHNTAW